jgi:hypothetical protein
MLRVTDDTPPRRRWPAGLAVALLAGCALGLHGTTPDALAGPVVPAKFAEKKGRPPLDASFVLPSDEADQMGVFAIRVGELLRTPGMENVAELYVGAMQAMVGDKEVQFQLTDVEQISGRVTVTQDPKQPPPNRSLSLSLTSIRMATDFDWVKQLRALGTEWTEHRHGDGRYYSSKVSIPLLGPVRTLWFYLPDARTVVLESEDNVKKLIDAKATPLRVAAWADEWKLVEGDTFALALTDVKGKLAKKVPPDEKAEGPDAVVLKPLRAVLDKTQSAVLGIDVGDRLDMKLLLTCEKAADVDAVHGECGHILSACRKIMSAADEPKTELEKVGWKFSDDMIRSTTVSNRVGGNRVDVSIKSKTGMAEFLKAFGAAK